MPGEAAFSGGHSMPKESSMPVEAAFSGGHSMPREAACLREQHSQGDTVTQHARGSSILRGPQHAQGELHA